MESKLVLLLVILGIICVIFLIWIWCQRAFEKKLIQLEKQYQQNLLTRCAYGDTLLYVVCRLVEVLPETEKCKMREEATLQKSITLECEKTDSTYGEAMAYEDVEKLFFKKNSAYENAS